MSPNRPALLSGVVGLADVADLAGDAGDVDDASAAAVEHVHDRGFAHVEGAGEVDAQHFVPVVDAHLPDGTVDGDAGVVDEDVQAAVLVDDLLDDALAVVGVADVALVQGQGAAVGLDRLAQFVGALLVGGVAGADDGAGGGEAVADRGADPAGAAGDQRDASGELVGALGRRLWVGVGDGHGGRLPFA